MRPCSSSCDLERAAALVAQIGHYELLFGGTEWTYAPLLAERRATTREVEVGMVEVGDRVELSAAKGGQPPHSGVASAVRGRMITVRWDSGEQSTVVPAPGTLSVLGHKTKSTGQTAEKAAKKTASNTATKAKKSAVRAKRPASSARKNAKR